MMKEFLSYDHKHVEMCDYVKTIHMWILIINNKQCTPKNLKNKTKKKFFFFFFFLKNSLNFIMTELLPLQDEYLTILQLNGNRSKVSSVTEPSNNNQESASSGGKPTGADS